MNAVYRMGRLLVDLEDYADSARDRRPTRFSGRPRFPWAASLAASPRTPSPISCRIDVDRRLIPGETAETAAEHLRAFLTGRPAIDFPFTLTQTHAACPPLSAALSGKLVAKFGAIIDSVVGKHTVHPVPFGTDASTVAGAGVPVVVFGPGDIAQAHTKDEWIDLAQLEPAAEILFRFACGK